MKTKDLIKILQTKENEEVEFIVVGKDGHIVCMDVKSTTTDLVKVLKFFNRGQ